MAVSFAVEVGSRCVALSVGGEEQSVPAVGGASGVERRSFAALP